MLEKKKDLSSVNALKNSLLSTGTTSIRDVLLSAGSFSLNRTPPTRFFSFLRVMDVCSADVTEEGVRTFLQQETAHLTLSHLDYFSHWLLLCCLEASTMEARNGRKRVWLQSVGERYRTWRGSVYFSRCFGSDLCSGFSEKSGSCVGNLKLSSPVTLQSEGVFFHRFLRSDLDPSEGPTACGLTSGDRVAVSGQESGFIGLATGYLCEVNRSSVSCTLDR